jgi:hypothetical protein
LIRGSDTPVGGRIGEITLNVREACRETIEHRRFDRFPAGRDRAPHVPTQIGDRPVVDRHTKDRTPQQTSTLEPIQRPKRHLLREITRDPEHDEHITGRPTHQRHSAIMGPGSIGRFTEVIDGVAAQRIPEPRLPEPRLPEPRLPLVASLTEQVGLRASRGRQSSNKNVRSRQLRVRHASRPSSDTARTSSTSSGCVIASSSLGTRSDAA